MTTTAARALLRGALVAAVLLYAALLRLDAITQTYGPVKRPAWLHNLQFAREGSSLLRPDRLRWDPAPVFPHRDGPPSAYRSDPYTYLQHAREMRFFYAASLREPLFPAATRVFLHVLDYQDVAVSFASGAFSVLAVLATFLLGAEAFSFAVGLGAAFLLAIEYDAITWGTGGWRDDAFMCAVALSAWGLLRCARAPTRRNAIVLGSVAAAACLVRITAVSFLVPGFIYLLAGRLPPSLKLRRTSRQGFGAQAPKPLRRERLKAVATAAAVTVLFVAPYLVNCWRAFGDPLYAINAHADVYRATEGQPVEDSQTGGSTLRPKRGRGRCARSTPSSSG